MDVVSIESKRIEGFRIRTSNVQEMNPKTAKIPDFVSHVDENLIIDYELGSRAWSVYHNYESDANGEYDILMGSDSVASSKLPLESVLVDSGTYLVFVGEGEFPMAIIETWQNVWSYFSDANCPHKRRFSTDFEYYNGPEKVSIHIAIE